MSGIDLAIAQRKLQEWLDADSAVSKGQRYTIAGREMTRADAAEIRTNIDYWNEKVVRLSRGNGGGIRVRLGVPC